MKLSKITYISKDRNFPVVKKKKNPCFLTKGLTQKQKLLYWTKKYLCPTSAVAQGHSKAQTGQLWAGRLNPKHRNCNLNTDFCCPCNVFLVFWLIKFNNSSWARKPQEESWVLFLFYINSMKTQSLNSSMVPSLPLPRIQGYHMDFRYMYFFIFYIFYTFDM